MFELLKECLNVPRELLYTILSYVPLHGLSHTQAHNCRVQLRVKCLILNYLPINQTQKHKLMVAVANYDFTEDETFRYTSEKITLVIYKKNHYVLILS